jgi:hypothetical protein
MELQYMGRVDVSRSDLMCKIRKVVLYCLTQVSPECGEFIITLDGVDHGGTYAMQEGDVVKVNILPLSAANAWLHRSDLPGILEDIAEEDRVYLDDDE